MMNIMGDLEDLGNALNPNPNPDPASLMRLGHCSALIKMIEDRDIYFSHVTWNRLESMLRIIKRYDFPYKLTAEKGSKLVRAVSISFSSYPGMIYSMDDYYVLSSGLAVMETTIINYNSELWAHVQPTNSVPALERIENVHIMNFFVFLSMRLYFLVQLFTGLRTMVANRLAHNGQMWTSLFTRYNSGQHNLRTRVFEVDLQQESLTIVTLFCIVLLI